MIGQRRRSAASRRRSALRGRRERGAVLVETALILPMLLMIALAVLDLGLAWRASMTVTSAARAGARVSSNLGTSWSTDRNALMSIDAALGAIDNGDVVAISIFRASSADGTVPPACITASARSAGGNAAARCNTYTGADLGNVGALSFPSSCSGRHQFYCPSTRQNRQGAVGGPDYVGVYVEIAHPTMTRLFGSTMSISETAVMRVEPNAGA
ncbi:MAG: pilus assembly protein [Microthrixaceae bacterium]